jgi:F-type H+-transporting ATPase subunit gamma
MASLKDMRNQISSVKATQKITKAMQMVAAAKLRRATESAENARPYAQRMSAVIANLAAGVSGDSAPKLLVGVGRQDRHLLVVATGDRGLAGGFNSSIVRLAREKILELEGQGKTVRVIAVGKKGRDQLRRLLGDKMIESYDLSAQRHLSLSTAQPIAAKVLEVFEAGEADVVTLIYSRYRSVIAQIPTARQLIPAQASGPASEPAGAAAPDLGGACYDYEPSEEDILEALLPRNISVQILSALLENMAGFYASQMSAMDNATRNAGDMISALTLKYNRSRQAQITKELIEIISGAEAL